MGFCPLDHVNKTGAYPTLGTLTCFGLAGATAGSGITFIACECAPTVALHYRRHTDKGRLTVGPFELTKLSAQVSVLMANQKNADPKRQAIAMSYHNKGTFQTLANIVKHRGLSGMYTGLNLHLCEYLLRFRQLIGSQAYKEVLQ